MKQHFFGNTVCNEKECSNKPASVNCHDWLSNCKLDINTSSCVEDCSSADYFYQTHEQCETYYPNKSCTLKPGAIKCVGLPVNCSFAQENQCFQDILGNKCYYSQTLNQCVDLSCSVLEFTNHLKCNQKLKTCTVKPTLNGCQSLEQCNNYIVQEQCQIDLVFQKCEWIINENKFQYYDINQNIQINSIQRRKVWLYTKKLYNCLVKRLFCKNLLIILWFEMYCQQVF